MSRLVAISDIHGEHDKLVTLMHNLIRAGVCLERDTLVFLGDYVDGGPDTKLVVHSLMQLRNLYPHWVFLKGNHEDMLANAYFERGRYGNDFLMWYMQGGRETHLSYNPTVNNWLPGIERVRQDIPQAHVLWLDRLPLFHESESFFFVHAGVEPGKPPQEVDEYNALWARNKFIKSKYDWGKRIVFGHTVANNGRPLVQDNKIGIDTMHHGYGDITAVILSDQRPAVAQFVTSAG